jgi:hypothetical protein
LPTISLGCIGPCQYSFRSLHGEANLVQNLPNMAGVVFNAEFFLNDPRDHWRCPNPAVQAVCRWTAVENISELSPLLFV